MRIWEMGKFTKEETALIKNSTERKIIVVESDGHPRLSQKIPLILIYNKTNNPYVDQLDPNQYPYTSLNKKYSFQLGTQISIKRN